MSIDPLPEPRPQLLRIGEMSGRERYQLLTSLIVPRPIGWVSSRSPAGMRNLAPFSYFAPIAATPPLCSIAIGSRRGSPKDTLLNIREGGGFCINVVTERQLTAMNETSGEHPPDVDEFEVAGVEAAEGELVSAPYVADCPAVMECRYDRHLEIEEARVVLVIGEVLGIRIAPELAFIPGTHLIDPTLLRPVGRLGGELYALLGELPSLARPVIP